MKNYNDYFDNITPRMSDEALVSAVLDKAAAKRKQRHVSPFMRLIPATLALAILVGGSAGAAVYLYASAGAVPIPPAAAPETSASDDGWMADLVVQMNQGLDNGTVSIENGRIVYRVNDVTKTINAWCDGHPDFAAFLEQYPEFREYMSQDIELVSWVEKNETMAKLPLIISTITDAGHLTADEYGVIVSDMMATYDKQVRDYINSAANAASNPAVPANVANNPVYDEIYNDGWSQFYNADVFNATYDTYDVNAKADEASKAAAAAATGGGGFNTATFNQVFNAGFNPYLNEAINAGLQAVWDSGGDAAWTNYWTEEWQKAEDGGYLDELKSYIEYKLYKDQGGAEIYQQLYDSSIGLLQR